MKLLCTCLVLAAVIVSRSEAAPLINETFSYSNGQLTSVSGGNWTQHSGSTNGQDVLGGLLSVNDTGNNDVNRALPVQSSGVVYAGFDLVVSATDAPSSGAFQYFTHFYSVSGANSGGTHLSLVGLQDSTGTDSILGIAGDTSGAFTP